MQELQALFWEEAEKYHIKPLLAGFSPFFGILPPLGTQTTTTYYGGVQNVAPGVVPRVYNHSYTISAELHIPDSGAEGVIVADANHLGGFSLFVQDGRLKHTYAFLGVFEYRQESEGQLPTGDVNVQMTFAADGAKPATGGEVTLSVNGERVGGGRMDHTVPFGFSGYSGLDVGRDNGLVVDRSYAEEGAVRLYWHGQEGGLRRGPPSRRQRRASPSRARPASSHRPRHQCLRPTSSRTKETAMSDTEFDVVIAAYLIPDLAQNDFDGLVKLVEGKQLEVEGVVLVTEDADGKVTVKETGDHMGRKGLAIGAGVGLAVGLFSPPLLASMVIGGAAGGLVGKFAKHRVESGIGEKMGAALPPGSAGIVAIYDRSKSGTVDAALASAVKKSVAQVDGGRAKQLKAALAEAQAGMGG